MRIFLLVILALLACSDAYDNYPDAPDDGTIETPDEPDYSWIPPPNTDICQYQPDEEMPVLVILTH